MRHLLHRIDVYQDALSDAGEWVFDRAIPWILYPTAFGLVLAVLAIAVWRFFHHQ